MANKETIEYRVASLEKELLALQERELTPRRIYPPVDEIKSVAKKYSKTLHEAIDWMNGAAWMKEYIENQMR